MRRPFRSCGPRTGGHPSATYAFLFTTMNYLCFIEKVSGGFTLRATDSDWETFSREIERRYPVAVRVCEAKGPPSTNGFWVFVARHLVEPDALDQRMIGAISHEIDVFMDARREPLPQAA